MCGYQNWGWRGMEEGELHESSKMVQASNLR